MALLHHIIQKQTIEGFDNDWQIDRGWKPNYARTPLIRSLYSVDNIFLYEIYSLLIKYNYTDPEKLIKLVYTELTGYRLLNHFKKIHSLLNKSKNKILNVTTSLNNTDIPFFLISLDNVKKELYYIIYTN